VTAQCAFSDDFRDGIWTKHDGDPCTKHYQVSPGHPPYETRARFLGELADPWYETLVAKPVRSPAI